VSDGTEPASARDPADLPFEPLMILNLKLNEDEQIRPPDV
jgi:hypothetical protein